MEKKRGKTAAVAVPRPAARCGGLLHSEVFFKFSARLPELFLALFQFLLPLSDLFLIVADLLAVASDFFAARATADILEQLGAVSF
jgi:hypothetical protein